MFREKITQRTHARTNTDILFLHVKGCAVSVHNPPLEVMRLSGCLFAAVPGCFLFLISACRAKKTACNRVGQNAVPGGAFGGSFSLLLFWFLVLYAHGTNLVLLLTTFGA